MIKGQLRHIFGQPELSLLYEKIKSEKNHMETSEKWETQLDKCKGFGYNIKIVNILGYPYPFAGKGPRERTNVTFGKCR